MISDCTSIGYAWGFITVIDAPFEPAEYIIRVAPVFTEKDWSSFSSGILSPLASWNEHSIAATIIMAFVVLVIELFLTALVLFFISSHNHDALNLQI
jgi:hypothetical protein